MRFSLANNCPHLAVGIHMLIVHEPSEASIFVWSVNAARANTQSEMWAEIQTIRVHNLYKLLKFLKKQCLIQYTFSQLTTSLFLSKNSDTQTCQDHFHFSFHCVRWSCPGTPQQKLRVQLFPGWSHLALTQQEQKQSVFNQELPGKNSTPYTHIYCTSRLTV